MWAHPDQTNNAYTINLTAQYAANFRARVDPRLSAGKPTVPPGFPIVFTAGGFAPLEVKRPYPRAGNA